MKETKCIFTHCTNKAEYVPVLIFPVYKNDRKVKDSEPNRVKIQQQVCERCRGLLSIQNFMTPSALEYYRAYYSQKGVEFPPVSTITLDFIPYVKTGPHEHQC